MRTVRIKATAGAYYHVICRIIDRQRLLMDEKNERIRGCSA